jgi:inner membrane protein
VADPLFDETPDSTFFRKPVTVSSPFFEDQFLPTIFTHAVVAGGAGHIFGGGKRLPLRFWVLSVVCSILPDSDVVSFSFGLPYSHFFGHRGFFHSILFASVLSVFVVCVFFRSYKLFSKTWWIYVSYFFVAGASHGVLDAFTDGGLGIALFSPFDSTRYFFPFRPLLVSPIGLKSFFSEWGAKVMITEVIYAWLPLLVLIIVVRIIRHKSSNPIRRNW